ncbi:hypothetical protein F4801DRAFT_223797 [Xylaria longipes]|nr:hypothetical protein F4801DRAFT_223797 [Xylaria longipes]
MPYIDLFRSHYKDVYVPVKDLPEPWRERLGLNDVDDAKTDVVNESCETPGEQPTLTPAERAACLSDSINDQGTHGLVKLCEAEDYIDFGPVICEKADLFICHDLPSRKLLSMLNGDSLILVAENPKLYDYTHVLRCLRLVIRSFPPLPAFSKDYRLSDLYHHDFDPEIGIIAPEHTAGTGQKRRIESGHQPLIRIPPPTEEEAYFANLYYHRDRRWWTFSSRLFWLTVKQLDFNSYACRDVVNCVVSQLVMRRRSRGWVPYSKSEDEDKKTTG